MYFRQFFPCILLVFFSITIYAQKESYNWYFGSNAGLSFLPSGTPSALTNSVMSSGKGCATISDSCTGQLYFYTNGDSIINRNHQTMLNGTNLDGSSGSTQSAIIVPSPDFSSGEFYVFTVERSNGLKYSVVDMNLASGLGAVVNGKKNILLVNPTVEKLTAVRHIDNKSIWIITHKVNSNEFYAFLLTASGITSNPVISSVGPVYGTGSQLGYMKASPRGDKVALALSGDKRFDVVDFDNSTGNISNLKSTASIYNFAYGVEFSPDGSKIYCSSNLGLFQYDLNSALPGKPLGDSALIATGVEVAIQLGPDGKIYCNEGYFLGVVNNPNNKAVLCNYNSATINLMGRFASSGLPTFIQSYFSPIAIVENGTCLGLNTDFQLSTDRQVDSIYWDFGDPGSGSLNNSTSYKPTHYYADSGMYTVTVYVSTFKCNQTNIDTVVKTIKILDLPIPEIDLGNDTSLCDGDSISLVTNGNEPSYIWSNGSKNSFIKIGSKGTHWVKATNQCGGLTDSIKVSFFQSSLNIDLGKDTAFCEGKSVLLQAGVGADNYEWIDGSMEAQLLVEEPGNYWVKGNDKCKTAIDTIYVNERDKPKVNLGKDTIICIGNTLKLDVSYPGASYIWSDQSNEAKIEITEEGSYRAKVTNGCGSANDDIYVRTKDCRCFVYVPNSFTPNNDGLNDVLSVSYTCEFVNYQLDIYNRWGELVFSSKNSESSWDGGRQVNGVYHYHLTYNSTDPTNQDKIEERGMINLVR